MATLAATSGSRTRGRFFGAASGSSGCSLREPYGLLRLPTRANVYTESPSFSKGRLEDRHRASEERASIRSLDHFIRPRQQRRRDRQAKRLGGLEVDDQLEGRRLLDRQIGGLGALEDLSRVSTDQAKGRS